MSPSDLPPEQPRDPGPDAGPSRTGGELVRDEVERRRPIGQRVRGTYRDVTAPVRAGFRAVGDWFRGLPRPAKTVVVLLILVAAVLLPYLLPAVTTRPNYWVAILLRVGIATILVMGLNVVVGFAGLLDLGYVAFFGIGAYTYAIMSGSVRFTLAQREGVENVLELKPEFEMYFWLIFLAAVVIAVLAGVILGAPTLRLRGDYLAIVTLGFGEIVRKLGDNLRGFTGGPLGVKSIPHPAIDVGPVEYAFGLANEAYYWLTLLFIGLAVFTVRRLNESRVGRAWAAIREDELAAAAMGVATVRMKLWAFAIGGAVASIAGVIFASQISFMNPATLALLNPTYGSITVLAMVVIGGMGSIWGPIFGASAIVILPELSRPVGDARFVVFGLALIIIMIFRPQGLIPSRRRAAELSGGEVREASVFEVRESAT
jgi:branched-chain amino acid transport system permease protein